MDASPATSLTDIPIRLLSGPRKAWLSLEGTVLTYRDRTWGGHTELNIPLELISVVEKKQFMGSRLIGALCWLLFSLFAGAGAYAIGRRLGIRARPEDEIALFVVWAAFAIIPFVVFLVRFHIRQRTITLIITPSAGSMTFWVLRKSKTIIDNLLQELRARQEYVQETMAYPHSYSVGDVVLHPLRRAIAWTFLAAIPATILQLPWLFLLCVVPVGMYLWGVIRMSSYPRLFRKAVSALMRREWEDAEAMTRELLRHSASDLRAQFLLVDIHLHRCRFEEAASLLASIQNELDPNIVQEMQSDIVWRRRMSERKQVTIVRIPGFSTTETPDVTVGADEKSPPRPLLSSTAFFSNGEPNPPIPGAKPVQTVLPPAEVTAPTSRGFASVLFRLDSSACACVRPTVAADSRRRPPFQSRSRGMHDKAREKRLSHVFNAWTSSLSFLGKNFDSIKRLRPGHSSSINKEQCGVTDRCPADLPDG
jgi:hypothetical protein